MQKRKYSLYYKINGRYYRMAESAYYKEVAVRVFQNQLLDGFRHQACLRPVKEGETTYLLVHGAYGRRYKSSTAALVDWNKGSDFKIHGGPYCSKQDDIHVFICLEDGTLVQAHGTPKEAPRAVSVLS